MRRIEYEVDAENTFFGGSVEVNFRRLALHEVKGALEALMEWGYIDPFDKPIEAAMDEVSSMDEYGMVMPYSGVTISAHTTNY